MADSNIIVVDELTNLEDTHALIRRVDDEIRFQGKIVLYFVSILYTK